MMVGNKSHKHQHPRRRQQQKQQKQQRRRSRNNKRRTTGNATAAIDHPHDNDVNEEIQEQLRRQRQRRQKSLLSSSSVPPHSQQDQEDQKQEKQHQKAKKKKAHMMGNYVYDTERESYFPKAYMKEITAQKKQQEEERYQPQWKKKDAASISIRNHRHPSHRPAWLAYMTELCNNGLQRRNLVCTWRGQLLLESIRVAKNNSLSSSIIINTQQMMNREIETTTESSLGNSRPVLPPSPPAASAAYYCSEQEAVAASAPWLRRFDVVNVENFDGQDNTPPSFVRVETDGYVRHHHHHPRDCGCYGCGVHVKVIRWNDSNARNTSSQSQEYGTHIGIVNTGEDMAGFQLYDSRGTLLIWDTSQRCINDFAFVGNNSNTLVYTTRTCPVVVDLNDGGVGNDNNNNYRQIRSINKESLCVESLDENGLVLLGNRDGTCLLCDLRASQSNSRNRNNTKASATSPANSNGSVVALHVLKHRPHQVLVRSQLSGMWCLKDLRTSLDQSIYDFGPDVFPPQSRTHIAQTCRGLATDPFESTLILPYIDNRLNDDAYLGLWSLDTGEYVGSKMLALDAVTEIAQNTTPWRPSSAPPPRLDLCPTRTRAWSRPERQQLTSGDEVEASVIPGSFGLWLDRGDRGIHHLWMDGRLDDVGS